jgi:phage replication O-like protein O
MKRLYMAKKRNGNPQTENGFIRISNELWDAWMCSRFTAREERMIKVVMRFSYGMNRTFALLSKSDLARFMNEHLPNVDRIMKSLLARGVIRVETTGSKGPLRFFLNKHYREWRVDQALQKDPDFFSRVVRRMFGDEGAPDETGYQSDKSGYQTDNPEVINSITCRLLDQEHGGYQSDNLLSDQASETVHEKPPGIHNKKTYEDMSISTTLVNAPSPVPDDHPFFAPLIDDHVFWNTLSSAYPDQDISAQVRKMTAWLMANPHRKHKDYKRFIQGWLAREERKENDHGKSRTDPKEIPAPFSDIPPELIA